MDEYSKNLLQIAGILIGAGIVYWFLTHVWGV